MAMNTMFIAMYSVVHATQGNKVNSVNIKRRFTSNLGSQNDKIDLYTIVTGNHFEMPCSFFAQISDIVAE